MGYSLIDCCNQIDFVYCIRIYLKLIGKFCEIENNKRKSKSSSFFDKKIFAQINLDFIGSKFHFIVEDFEMRWQTNTNNHKKNVQKIPYKSCTFIYTTN